MKALSNRHLRNFIDTRLHWNQRATAHSGAFKSGHDDLPAGTHNVVRRITEHEVVMLFHAEVLPDPSLIQFAEGLRVFIAEETKLDLGSRGEGVLVRGHISEGQERWHGSSPLQFTLRRLRPYVQYLVCHDYDV